MCVGRQPAILGVRIAARVRPQRHIRLRLCLRPQGPNKFTPYALYDHSATGHLFRVFGRRSFLIRLTSFGLTETTARCYASHDLLVDYKRLSIKTETGAGTREGRFTLPSSAQLRKSRGKNVPHKEGAAGFPRFLTVKEQLLPEIKAPASTRGGRTCLTTKLGKYTMKT